jgi:hypothetical protein
VAVIITSLATTPRLFTRLVLIVASEPPPNPNIARIGPEGAVVVVVVVVGAAVVVVVVVPGDAVVVVVVVSGTGANTFQVSAVGVTVKLAGVINQKPNLLPPKFITLFLVIYS